MAGSQENLEKYLCLGNKKSHRVNVHYVPKARLNLVQICEELLLMHEQHDGAPTAIM